MRNLLIMFAFLAIVGTSSTAQTFNCYISNEKLVSPTEYQFDVYMQSTSTPFSLRTFQGSFTFNPSFIPEGSSVRTSFVPKSTDLKRYQPTKMEWSNSGTGFQVAANSAGTCTDGTIITTAAPVRIGTFKLTCSSEFNKSDAKVSIVTHKDAVPAGLSLKTAITKWNANDCSTGTNKTITSEGTYATRLSGSTTTKENDWNVYPNPATNVVYLNSNIDDVKSIMAVNSLGQKMALKYTTVKNGGTIELHIESLAPGVYQLEIQTADKMVTKSFVKE